MKTDDHAAAAYMRLVESGQMRRYLVITRTSSGSACAYSGDEEKDAMLAFTGSAAQWLIENTAADDDTIVEIREGTYPDGAVFTALTHQREVVSIIRGMSRDRYIEIGPETFQRH